MENIELEYVCNIRVRYAETDTMGFVYNGNYLTYFEVARTELMRNYGMPYSVLEKQGFNLPLIDAYVKYIAPAHYDEVLDIKGKISWSGEPKLKFDYEVYVNDKLISEGYTRHAFLSKKTGTPVRPPEIFKESMKKAGKKNT